jgi:hypothetical protein
MVMEKSSLNTCQLTDLKLSCFGCCGHDFAEKPVLRRDVKINTELCTRHKDDLESLKETSKELRLSGICKFLIFLDDSMIGCILHPACNKGEDKRKDHCDIDFICTTKREFESWEAEIQERFIEYVKSKDLDFIDYSIKMAKGNLLGGFKISGRGP